MNAVSSISYAPMSAINRAFSAKTVPSRFAASSMYPTTSRACVVVRNASDRSSIHFTGAPSSFDSTAATKSSP